MIRIQPGSLRVGNEVVIHNGRLNLHGIVSNVVPPNLVWLEVMRAPTGEVVAAQMVQLVEGAVCWVRKPGREGEPPPRPFRAP